MAKQSFIEIKGARVNNLKNMDVKIPHGKFTVITGLSGSGKSSLAFDTLYAEGQRRYIESMSSYARQFLGKLDKPEADYIKGVVPAIAIQQKVISTNPRSTVGTVTEIYDYLKLLFARVGKTFSPISGNEVKKDTVTDVINYIVEQDENERILLLCPLPKLAVYGAKKQLEVLQTQGFARIYADKTVVSIEEALQNPPETFELIVDRFSGDLTSEEATARIGDSVGIAFSEGNGECTAYLMKADHRQFFSTRFELDGMEFTEPSEHFFTFNNPYGACKTCEGYGQTIGIDEDLVLPNKNLSVYEGAIAPWKGDMLGEYKNELIKNAAKFDFPIHRPIKDLTPEQYKLLWTGNKYFTGITPFFKFCETQTYKIHYRVLLSRYRGKTDCPECNGTRLRGDAAYVKIGGKSIQDLVLMPIDELLVYFQQLEVATFEERITKRLLPEITNRLTFLTKVGLTYLTLNRRSNSLSGGESQRINLATSLGSSLVGSMYILDEPSIGLHPRDTERLVNVLHNLRDLGNTVIVVEHEEEIIRAADEILDIGPMAGVYGGEVVFQGDHKALLKAKGSLTADYLTGKKVITTPVRRRTSKNALNFTGIYKNNLKDVSVALPLHSLVCITGVSGSGKSTLLKDIVYPAVRQHLGELASTVGSQFEVNGDWKHIQAVELIDQNPIGKSTRSNPASYVKAFDDIRDLFSKQPLAKARGYKPGFFSFNVEGGRCEICEGEGIITVGMQFMADIHLKCETCEGTRYKQEALEIHYREQSVADILNMDIDAAVEFFKAGNDKADQKILEKILPLQDVGLGYLKMGQASSTLSGGEAQRVKLASFLSKGLKAIPTLFIFDEPTTGLHFHDVQKLIIAMQRLVDAGHSVFIIEHNNDVIKCADWIIDIGPDGGKHGGQIVFTGTPEELVKCEESITGKYLRI